MTEARWPAEDQEDSLQHQFVSGEKRDERVESDGFAMRKMGLLFALGGPEKAAAAFKKNGGDWARRFPGPAADGTVESTLRAFSTWFEALTHGDEHSLIKDWANTYAEAANFVVPFPLIDPWKAPGEKPGPPKITAVQWVVVNHPEDHMRIAAEHPKKSAFMASTHYGENFLAHNDNDEWRRRRFAMISAVAPNEIKDYFHKMERHGRKLVAALKDPNRGTFFYGARGPSASYNIHEMVEHTAFAVACDCLYGLPDSVVDEQSRVVRWALQTEHAGPGKGKVLSAWAKLLHARPTQEHGPLLRMLGEAHEGGYTRAYRDDVGILSIAMHDTTASTMTWCLMELARRPELQAAVAKEARTVLRQRAGASASARAEGMTYADLYKMPLLTKVINETLRMYPAVAYGSRRELEKDEWLHVGPAGSQEKVLVPKGTNVLLHNFANHHSKALWGDDADEFKPERWEGFGDKDSLNFPTDDASPNGFKCPYSARNPQSARFHPFTRAPRDCFGKNFAQAEMRVILPVLLSELEFKLAEPTATLVATRGPESITYSLSGILKPRDGLWMTAKPRIVDLDLPAPIARNPTMANGALPRARL